MSLTAEQKDVIVAQMLSVWKNTKQDTISMEKELYLDFFSFLRPIHTVHNKRTGNPIIFVFNRLDTIRETKIRYNFREMGELDASQLR